MPDLKSRLRRACYGDGVIPYFAMVHPESPDVCVGSLYDIILLLQVYCFFWLSPTVRGAGLHLDKEEDASVLVYRHDVYVTVSAVPVTVPDIPSLPPQVKYGLLLSPFSQIIVLCHQQIPFFTCCFSNGC